MLASSNRMRRSADFSLVVRRGRRAGAEHLVVHQVDALRAPDQAPLVGLVVAKSVGNSVARHRVSRRLRALMAARIESLPAGSGTVVRALPPAADAASAVLAADLDRTQRVFARRRGVAR